jgi:hypothetical protein
VRLEGLGELKKSTDLFGNRTRGILACGIVPQPTALSLGEPEDEPELRAVMQSVGVHEFRCMKLVHCRTGI